MKVTILAFGTRGDVQPFIALGLGLKQAGDTVTIAAANEFKEFVEDYGLIYSSLNYDIKKDITRALDEKFDKKQKSPLTKYKQQKLEWPKLMKTWLDNSYEASKGCDIFIYSGLAVMYGIHIAEKLQVPSIPIQLQPMMLTSEIPFMMFPDLKIGGWYNRLTYKIYAKGEWHMIGSAINQWRRENGLREINAKKSFILKYKSQTPLLYGFSSYVFPKARDWGNHISIAGYFFLDQLKNWQPPPGLLNFLQAGPPPVYVGFGSSSISNNEETTQMIMEALKKTGERGLLSTGWGAMKETRLPDNMFMVNDIPHHWLFPHTKAVVHHGGAGTTAEGLRAGVPSVIVPMGPDAGFWANQLYKIGTSPQSCSFKNLNVSKLATIINEAIHNKTIKERANVIGRKIRNENGVANAVNTIKQLVNPSIL